MIRNRWAAYAAVLMSVVIGLGCGDTFRPTAIPVPQPGPDPSAVKHAVVVNTGGALGTVVNENLSGDTIVLQRNAGAEPVHAGLIAAGTKLYVANRGDDTVSAYSTFAAVIARTASLPAGSDPVFVHTTENTFVYVANSGSVASVCGGGGSVGVISVQQDALIASICVNGAPVALAESVDGLRLYAVSPTTNSVTPIATQDRIPGAPLGVGSNPVWAVADTVSNRWLFVANSGDDTVTVIDMPSNAVVSTIPVGANPTFLLYDTALRRVYVANTGGNSVSIIDAAGPVPALLTTVAVGSAPRSVTALADGSRAYVANSGSDTVSVINTNSNTVVKTIAVGDQPVSITSGLNSTKVIVANFAGSSISVIRTSDDSVVATHASPKRDPSCTTSCPLQNPAFVLATP